VALALMTLGAVALNPDDLRVALGVVGGGVLAALSYRAIRSGVAGMGAGEGGARRRTRWSGLVKFFTRHAILALAAYGMMVRLHLDPVGMLAGASSLVVATGVEAIRSLRRP